MSVVPTVEIEIDGHTYTLAENFNAYRAFDGVTEGDILNDSRDLLVEGSSDEVVAWVWALLQKHHPDVTIEDVGEMLNPASQTEIFSKVRELQMKALEAAGISTEEKGDAEGEASPSDGSSSGLSDAATSD